MKGFLPLLILSAMLVCSGCATRSFSNMRVQHLMPLSGISVAEDKILHEGSVFAELRFYFTSHRSESPGEAYLFSSATQHRGLAIFYTNENQLVWIFPEDGRDEDVKTGQFKARGQTDGYVGWAYDVYISQDGKFVYWKKPGLISQSSYVFSVEHGKSMLIDTDYNL